MKGTDTNIDPALRALAVLWEEKGYTGPDRHDMLLAQLGERVRVAEVGQDGPDDPIKVMCGESTPRQVRRMFREVPDDHPLGIVHVMLGKGAASDLLHFITQQAMGPGPRGPRSTGQGG
jgi:hypothetical protein